MAALSDKIGVLFTIKADANQAEREFKKFKKDLDDIDAQGKDQLQKLASAAGLSAAQFSSLTVAATAAVAVIGAVSIAAVAAAAGIWKLTVAAADYGAEIFDASEKTGVSAVTLSALRYAAETSGSSFEKVTNAIAKFNVLLGEAATGNVKAQETLDDFGITSRDTTTALEQAIKVIAQETNSTKQAALAKALFKDRTADILPVIKSFNGDLSGLIRRLSEMGVVTTDEAARAADEFGDTLDTLKTQAAAVGRQFAQELMPQITQAMSAISTAMIENKGVAEAWGKSIINTVNGMGIVVGGLRTTWDQLFKIMTLGFGSTAASAAVWGAAIDAGLQLAFGYLGTAIRQLERLGALMPAYGSGTGSLAFAVPGLGGSVGDSVKAGGGGGSRGGGGRGGGTPDDDAERVRKEAVEAARKAVQATLEVYKEGNQERIAQLELSLSRGEILEIESIRDIARVRLEGLMDEKRLTESLLANKQINLSEEERLDILQQIKILTIQIRVEKLKGGKELNDQVKKEIADADKRIAQEKELLETERKRRNELEKIAANVEKQKEIDRLNQLDAQKRSSQRIDGGGSQWQSLFDYLQGDNQFKDNNALIAGIDVMRLAFEGLAQAIGQVVQAWVLYGNAGTSVKKVTAQILAGIAQQAAVKAIFELAEGFAALARAFFGDPKAGAEAAMHFKSAAIYGTVAGIAAVAGRGVAGDSFAQTAGGAGSGGGSGEQSEPRVNFGQRFRGYGESQSEALRQNTMVMAQMEESLNTFNRKFGTASPEAVVMAGAGGASRAIRGAIESELSSDVGTTDGFMRGLGFAR